MSTALKICEIEKVKQGYYALILENEGLDLSTEIPGVELLSGGAGSADGTGGACASGRLRLVIQADLLVQEGLAKGQQLTEEGLKVLAAAAADMAIYHQALRLLTGSEHFVEQLRIKLLQRRYSREAVEAVLERLLAEGLLDDARAAQHWVLARQHRKSIGAMREALRGYGVTAAAMAEALSTIEVSPETVLVEKAEKKWRQLMGEEPKKREERLFGHLMRQGYDYSACKRALAAIKAMEADGDTGLDN